MGTSPSKDDVIASNELHIPLGKPTLIIPSIQLNIRAGVLPEPESNGIRYLKTPLNVL